MLPYRQNIKNPTNLVGTGVPDGPRAIRESPLQSKISNAHKPVGAGVPDCPCKTQYFFINRCTNVVLLLNQENHELLIRRKRWMSSPFFHNSSSASLPLEKAFLDYRFAIWCYPFDCRGDASRFLFFTFAENISSDSIIFTRKSNLY